MKFIVTLDRDEDGVWIAECPAIPGCVSQGTTREEALGNVRTPSSYVLSCARNGDPQTMDYRSRSVGNACLPTLSGREVEREHCYDPHQRHL